MFIYKLYNILQTSSSIANRVVAMCQGYNIYIKSNRRTAILIFILITIFCVSLISLYFGLRELHLLSTLIFITFSFLLFIMALPFGGLLVSEFGVRGLKEIKDYRPIIIKNSVVLKEVSNIQNVLNNSHPKFIYKFIENKESLVEQSKQQNNFTIKTDYFKKTNISVKKGGESNSKTGPKLFAKPIFMAIKFGVIHHFIRSKCREDLAEGKENFFKSTAKKEGVEFGNFKNHYNKFCKETGNLDVYFKQKTRINYLELLIEDSDIKLYPIIVQSLNKTKERINSN